MYQGINHIRYMLVAQAMLSETSGMFIEANRDDHSFFINPNCAADMTYDRKTHSVLQVDACTVCSESAVHYLDAFRAAGRFIGRALLDGQVLPLHLSPVLFKVPASFHFLAYVSCGVALPWHALHAR